MKRALPVLILLFAVAYGILRFAPRPAAMGGEFNLSSAEGPVTLRQLRGHVVLLYFGYMSCPDVCPTSLSVWKTALSSLRPDELARVRPLFVSVDPERDTAANLRTYGAFFHPSILGVTGTPAELSRVAAAYGAHYDKVISSSALTYTIDHTASTYVVGPDGRLTATVSHRAPADELVNAVRAALSR